ncbi:MAG TPA: DUF4149 domain-containing protein [Balneolaceae bacterium]
MAFIYKTAVYLHIASAIFWIGGMLFTAVVLVPASRHKLLEAKRGLLFTVIGKKFSRISWALFVVLIITGHIQLWARGFTIDILMTGDFWQTGFGATLHTKLHLFALVLIISGLHDFWLGPKAARLMDEQPAAEKTNRFRKITSWAGRINLLLGLLILYFAITLVRG